MTLKVAIIGCGSIAQNRHIPALLKLQEEAEIIALSDTNERLLAETASKLNIKSYSTNYKDILHLADAVVICTPNKFHEEMTVTALEAGCHVLCEKPMALNTEECKRMIAASEKSGKLLTVGFHHRHTDASRLAKEIIQSGDFGNVLVSRVKAMRQRKVPGWGVFTNKALQGGGSLIDFGCHVLDLALWLQEDNEPQEVIGRSYNALSRQPNQVNEWGKIDHETFDVDDHVTAYLTFKNGSSLILECSWAANIKEDEMSVNLSGDQQGLNIFPFERYYPEHGFMHVSEANVSHDEIVAGDRQMENFVLSCLGKAELVVKAEEALKVSEIMEAIYKSSEMGSSVKLSLV